MARPQKRPLVAREVHESNEALEAAALADALLFAPSTLRLADGASAAIGSPARALQAELAASFAENSQSDRLPAGPLVLALVVASLMGWTGMIVAARDMFF
ncbi:hypothetical protein [Phenylobacterium sp.]|uniref:hypothetical protein n=1 Tax=Phenylobacterium sp. TaxID=1871053 RepID=UPI00271E3C38|nr:hypothetical protein [Phenylobacterium sp.]MDO8380063.1 hypothetical protein [Phenylobacterium sp.]